MQHREDRAINFFFETEQNQVSENTINFGLHQNPSITRPSSISLVHLFLKDLFHKPQVAHSNDKHVPVNDIIFIESLILLDIWGV